MIAGEGGSPGILFSVQKADERYCIPDWKPVENRLATFNLLKCQKNMVCIMVMIVGYFIPQSNSYATSLKASL